MYEIFLLLALGLFAAIAWRSRPLAVAVLAAVLPTYLLRFSVVGIPLTLLEGMILVLAAVWTIKGEWKRVKTLPRPWLIAAALLFVAAILAACTSTDRHAGIGLLKAYFIEPILLFLVATTTITSCKEKGQILMAFGLGAAAASLVGIVQYVTGLGIPIPWDIERRVTGPFPYPNALGLYAAPAATLAIVRLADLLRHHRSATKRIALWAGIAVLCVAGIVLAQSEAAVVAVVATLFLGSLFSPVLRRWTIPVVTLGAIALALSPVGHTIVQKLTFQDYSGEVRRGMWEETWQMLRDRPLFGAGLGGYPAAMVRYHTHTAQEIFQDPHTLVLNIWTELGLLGLAAFIFLAWTTGRTLMNAKSGPDRALALAAFAALAASTIHGLADVPYFKNDLSALTWILLALIATAYEHRLSFRANR